VTVLYWDASALVKRYAAEAGTPVVNAAFSSVAGDRMLCSSVATGEIISALVRKRNAGGISAEVFEQAMSNFRAEVLDAPDFQILATTDALILASHPLIVRHSLNATDAIVLRSVLDVAAVLRPRGDRVALLTADDRLLRAAREESIPTINPETDPVDRLMVVIGG
jgi:predicted nucleic acid-binding protein